MIRETKMLRGHSTGTPPEHKGSKPFTPYIGCTPGTPVLLPTCTSASLEVLPLPPPH